MRFKYSMAFKTLWKQKIAKETQDLKDMPQIRVRYPGNSQSRSVYQSLH